MHDGQLLTGHSRQIQRYVCIHPHRCQKVISHQCIRKIDLFDFKYRQFEYNLVMRYHKLDLNLLVALDAILVDGSVSRAAKRIHLSQPAMSGALARLRAYFGDELFVQVGRKLVPTPLAESLARPVRDILMRVDTTIVATPGFNPLVSDRKFSIIASDYMMAVLVDKLLARAYDEAPGITFQIFSTDNSDEMIERGEVDLLMIPEHFALPGHPTEPTIEDSYTCVAWQHNTELGDILTLEQYLAMGHVTSILGPNRMPTFEGWFLKNFGVSRKVEVVTYNLTSPAMLVIGTNRIATVHTKLARAYACHLPLRLFSPPVDFPRLKMVMQWHRYKSLDPSIIWLRRLIRELVAVDVPT